MIHYIESMNREEIALIAGEALAVFPTASMEQHGPHLAIRVDTALAMAVIERALPQLTVKRPILVLPPMHFGASHHHLAWAGVLSLQSDTYMNAIRDICECLINQGTRRILIVNGHGGNDPLNQAAVRDINTKHAVQIAAFSYWNFDHAALDAAAPEGFGHIPGHAADFETACMLAAAPRQVAPDWMDRVKAAIRDASQDGGTPRFIVGSPAGPPTLGFVDDCAHASAATGAEMLDIAAAAMARYVNGQFGP